MALWLALTPSRKKIINERPILNLYKGKISSA
jgi:hypothetical protein